jgi:hypothetical protein
MVVEAHVGSNAATQLRVIEEANPIDHGEAPALAPASSTATHRSAPPVSVASPLFVRPACPGYPGRSSVRRIRCEGYAVKEAP